MKIGMTEPQLKWIDNNSREFLIEGSAGSGKTRFACYKIIFYALDYENAAIFVYRKTLPSLKKTAWREIRMILYEMEIYDLCHENKSEGYIEFPNGSIIYFGALDDIGKVRSINADLVYIEQAEELNDTAFYTELILRLGRGPVSKRGDGYTQMLLVVQPESEEHWIYKRYHEYYDAKNEYEREKQKVLTHNKKNPTNLWDYRDYDTVLADIKKRRKTAHFHYSTNSYLHEENREQYENLKNEDYELWLRYSAGKWGKLTGVIYKNWDTICDRTHFDFYTFGADFGFNNPSCFLLGAFYDNECYVLDEIYEPELTTPELIDKVKDMLFTNSLLPEQLDTGYGDAAEPDRIEEFNQAGFPMVGGIKDVQAKINSTKQTKIHIHPKCENTIREIKGYKYRTNKDGIALDEPIKINDHAMDALGYMVYGRLGALSPFRQKPGDYYEDEMMVF